MPSPLSEQPASAAPPRVERLTDRLPALLPATSYMVSAMGDPGLEMSRVPALLETSPSIAARVLALANSAWSSPLEPITSLPAACSRLGLRIVRTVSIAMAVADCFQPADDGLFDKRRFWRSSLLAADAGLWLAEKLDPEAQQTARTASLLARLGLVWLAEYQPDATQQALQARRLQPQTPLNDALRRYGGLGYDDVGLEMARYWRLPQPLCEAIGNQRSTDPDCSPVTVCVAGAARMCHALAAGREWTAADAVPLSLPADEAAQVRAFEKLHQSREDKTRLAELISRDRGTRPPG